MAKNTEASALPLFNVDDVRLGDVFVRINFNSNQTGLNIKILIVYSIVKSQTSDTGIIYCLSLDWNTDDIQTICEDSNCFSRQVIPFGNFLSSVNLISPVGSEIFKTIHLIQSLIGRGLVHHRVSS